MTTPNICVNLQICFDSLALYLVHHSRVTGFIHNQPSLHDLTNEGIPPAQPFRYLARFPYQDVNRKTCADAPSDFQRGTAAVRALSRHNHHYINVRSFGWRAISVRAEKNDFLGLELPSDRFALAADFLP